MMEPFFKYWVANFGLVELPFSEEPEMEAKHAVHGSAAAPRLMYVAPAEFVPTPDNRKVDEKSAKFLSLLESVTAAGVKVPLIARPVKGGKYEVPLTASSAGAARSGRSSKRSRLTCRR